MSVEERQAAVPTPATRYLRGPRSAPRSASCTRTARIQLKKARQDFVANRVWPAIAPWFLLATLPGVVVFMVLVVEYELTGGLDVGPSVGV